MITLSTVYRKCISGQPFVSLIEGPPGTGKFEMKIKIKFSTPIENLCPQAKVD